MTHSPRVLGCLFVLLISPLNAQELPLVDAAHWPADGLRLTSFTAQPADDAATNATRKLNFLDHALPCDVDAEDLDALGTYGDSLLAANRDLLGLAQTGAGRIVRTAMNKADFVTCANYEQRARLADGSEVPVINTSVGLRWAHSGAEIDSARLVQVVAITYRDVDGLSPARIERGEIEGLARRLEVPVTVQMDESAPNDPRFPPAPRTQKLIDITGLLHPERIDVLRLGVLALQGHAPRLVWELGVEGPLEGVVKQYFDFKALEMRLTTVRGSYALYVDAHDGSVVQCVEAMAHAQTPGYTAVGTGQVFDPNPIEMGGAVGSYPYAPYYGPPIQVSLYELADANTPNDGYLRNRYVQAHDTQALGDIYCPAGTPQGPSNPPGCVGLQVNYFAAPFPTNYLMAQVTPFHAISRRGTFADAIGFPSALPASIWVECLDSTHFSSSYDPSTTRISLNSSLPESYDGDVNVHEYGHAIHHIIGIATQSPGYLNYPFHITGTFGSGAMNEGGSDYQAVSFFNELELGEWVGQYPNGYLRRLATSRNVVDNWVQEIHSDGVIWGTALYRLRNILGKGVVDRLVLEFPYHILPTDNIQQGFDALRVAAQVLSPGSGGLSIYDEQLRTVFSLAKIRGSAPVYDWQARVGQGLAYVTPRPYPDTYTHTEVFNIPGAANVRLLFDPYTGVNESDTLRVLNAQDQVVASYSNFDARGVTVTVPGDTAKVQLNSATDSLGGSGFGVVFARAFDPNVPNQFPVIVARISELSPGHHDPLVVEIDLARSRDPDGQIVAWSVLPQPGSKETLEVQMDPLAKRFVPKITHVFNRDGAFPILKSTTFKIRIALTDDLGGTSVLTVPITVDPYQP